MQHLGDDDTLTKVQARRVKCDEAKPYCRRCTAFGRSCGGYEFVRSEQASPNIRRPSSPLALGSSEDIQAAELFFRHTALELVGSVRCEFWSSLVLQAVQSDPGVRHGALALASTHREFELSGDVRSVRNPFAIQHYNQAIQDHLQRISSAQDDAYNLGSYLISCVLFIGIEMLQFHYASAVLLIRQAVRLLNDLIANGLGRSLWPLDVLEGVVCRLQSQTIALLGPKVFQDTLLPRTKAASITPIPSAFTSVDQARMYYDFHRTWHDLTIDAHEALHLHDGLYEVNIYYHNIVRQWTSSVSMLEKESGPHSSSSDGRALNVLKVRQRLLMTSQQIASTISTLFEHEDAWDNHLDCLKEILDLCQEIVNTRASSSPVLNTFTLDLDIIAPLYDIVRMCRDPQLRRRAINLLWRYRRREGLLDSALAARVAQRGVELEEGAVDGIVQTAADVPQWARLRAIIPRFSSSTDEIVVRYYRRCDSACPDRATVFEETMHL